MNATERTGEDLIHEVERMRRRVSELERSNAGLKLANETLEEEATRCRLLVEQSRDGIVVIDENGKVYDANPRYAELLGYSMEEVLQLHLWDWDANFTGEQLREMLRSVDERGDHFETRHRRKDGTYYDVEISTNGTLCGDRKLVFCVCRDISERKRSEAQLRESEERFRTVMENLPDAVFVHDLDGRILLANRTTCRSSGYTQDELVRMTVEDIDPGSVARRDRREIWFRLGKENYAKLEAVHRRKDGREYPVDLHLTPIQIEGMPAILTLARDITARKRAAEDTARLEAQLRQSQKMETIGTLSGGIAHDFNNILGIIIGYAELALEDIPASHPAYEKLEAIRTAGLGVRDIIRQLLTFSHKMDLEIKPVNITQVVKDSLCLLRSSIPKTVEIRHRFRTGDQTILADPTQIGQIVMNLCVNAAQAMEIGGGVLTIDAETTTVGADETAAAWGLSPGEYVRLSVTDTGCGIDPELHDRIFDPYFTTKDVGKGSGLGLAVVHGIVKSHNGAVTVDSAPEKGSTFSVFLPVTSERVSCDLERRRERPTGKEAILFVDDEACMAELGKETLGRLGYRVEAVSSPEEALRLFREDPSRYDLVITDMTMPRMTGEILFKEITAIRGDIPVVLSTGFSSLIDEKRAKMLGFAGYLMKPMDRCELAQTIRTLLDAPEPSPAARRSP